MYVNKFEQAIKLEEKIVKSNLTKVGFIGGKMEIRRVFKKCIKKAGYLPPYGEKLGRSSEHAWL